jgi:hypothetical protein
VISNVGSWQKKGFFYHRRQFLLKNYFIFLGKRDIGGERGEVFEVGITGVIS